MLSGRSHRFRHACPVEALAINLIEMSMIPSTPADTGTVKTDGIVLWNHSPVPSASYNSILYDPKKQSSTCSIITGRNPNRPCPGSICSQDMSGRNIGLTEVN